MLKKIIKYIFIYTICVITIGCESNPMSNQTCDYCYLELEAPDLPMDENGIYHLDYIDGDSSNKSFENLRLLCPNHYFLYNGRFPKSKEFVK